MFGPPSATGSCTTAREDYITFIAWKENLVQILRDVAKTTLHRYGAPSDHCHQPTINSLIFLKESFRGKGSGMPLTHIMHGTPYQDRGDGRATGQPQGFGPEAHSFSTAQGSPRQPPRDELGMAGQARPGGARLPTLQHAARRRRGGLPPKGFETRTQSACLRRPQSRKGEKCKQFCLSLSFLVLPPSPPVSPQAGPACCRDHAAAWRLCRLVPKPFGERPPCRIPLHRG